MSITAAYPVLERIAVELYDRLRFLLAGYDPLTPISEVVRPLRIGGYTPKHLQIVVTHEDPERNPDLNCPGKPPAAAWDVRFNIRCHAMPSESDTTPVDRYLASMAANVVRVVCDESLDIVIPWHTMGDLAINANWDNWEQIDADGGVDGVNVPLLVTYRTDENNPFNVR